MSQLEMKHGSASGKSSTRPRPIPRAGGKTACRAVPMAAWTSGFRLPGSARIGTNPEQLFAAGWSACFESAIALAARKRKIVAAGGRRDRRRSDLNLADDGYFLSARLNISLPGVERDVAQALVDEAHQICPYSKATRGNIDVAINLV